MALLYRYDQEIAKYQAKTTDTSNYRSDQKAALFGGRGGRDQEIAYLNAKSGETGQTNDKLSDAWGRFAAKRGVTTENRRGTRKRLFFEEKTFP